MPRLKSETVGAGDQSWLGSSHGIHDARTVTLDVSAFTAATHYPDGYIPSGTPLALVTTTQPQGAEVGKYVVYDPTFDADTGTAGTQSDGRDVLAGFLLTDQPTDGSADIAVPLLDHGRIKVANLPIAFTAPAEGSDNGQFVYV